MHKPTRTRSHTCTHVHAHLLQGAHAVTNFDLVNVLHAPLQLSPTVYAQLIALGSKAVAAGQVAMPAAVTPAAVPSQQTLQQQQRQQQQCSHQPHAAERAGRSSQPLVGSELASDGLGSPLRSIDSPLSSASAATCTAWGSSAQWGEAAAALGHARCSTSSGHTTGPPSPSTAVTPTLMGACMGGSDNAALAAAAVAGARRGEKRAGAEHITAAAPAAPVGRNTHTALARISDQHDAMRVASCMSMTHLMQQAEVARANIDMLCTLFKKRREHESGPAAAATIATAAPAQAAPAAGTLAPCSSGGSGSLRCGSAERAGCQPLAAQLLNGRGRADAGVAAATTCSSAQHSSLEYAYQAEGGDGGQRRIRLALEVGAPQPITGDCITPTSAPLPIAAASAGVHRTLLAIPSAAKGLELAAALVTTPTANSATLSAAWAAGSASVTSDDEELDLALAFGMGCLEGGGFEEDEALADQLFEGMLFGRADSSL